MLKKFFLLCFIGIFVLSASVSLSSNDYESYFIGLRYPKSYDLKTYHQSPEVYTVVYKVRLLFPSNKVVQFYDKALKEIGCVPFVQPNYPNYFRKWQEFVDATIKGNPLVHQLIAYWTNKDHTRMIVLGIRYYSYYLTKPENKYARGQPPDNCIQKVFC